MSSSVKKNSIYNAIKTISTIIFPLITFPYISRVLLVDNIGKINFGSSIISYFWLLATLGINTYAIRECSKVSDERQKLSVVASEIYSINIISMMISYVIFAITIILWKEIKDYRLLIIIQSFTIFFNTIGVDWINQAVEDFKYITIRTVAFQILSIVLMVIFVKKPEDYIVYAIITVISTSGANIVNYFYKKRFCDIHFTINNNYKKHLKPIIYLFVMILAQTIFNNIDMTMLALLKSDYEVGIYSTSFRINNVISQLVASILWVLLPRMSTLFSNNDFDSINYLLNKTLKINVIIGFPCFLGTVLLSKDIILLFAGKEFMESAKVLDVLMVGFLINVFGGMFLGNLILLPCGREKYYMVVCCVTSVFNAILNYILIPYYGAEGAAITTTLSHLLILILLLFRFDKRIKIIVPFKTLIFSIIGGACIYVICGLLKNVDNIFLRVSLSTTLSVMVYFGFLLLCKEELVLETYKLVLKKIKQI